MHNCEHLKNAYDLETSENENILKAWTKLERCIALSKVLWDNKLALHWKENLNLQQNRATSLDI